jgi:5-(carboxyamino)imidazole ribonucleotide synthase
VTQDKRWPRVGMVGGGQLARMTHPAAINLGVGFSVLAATPDESAAQVIRDPVIADEKQLADLREFAAGCDVVTFDHEQVPPDHLQALVASGVTLRPGPDALRYAQDKGAMRTRLTEIGIPCPPHRLVASPADVATFAADHGWPVILKTTRGGYDGKGVWLASSESETAEPFKAGVPVLVEERVDFARELSAVVARSPHGQAVAYPVVESVQRDGICVEVIAPAPNLAPDLAVEAQRIALEIAESLGVVGILAGEMFETRDGRLLVNELAMRPHNSGHWTIDGAVTSQFENHLRAVADLPLGSTDVRAPSAMVNIIGGADDPRTRLASALGLRDVAVHLYGKEARPGRKLGHVTASGADVASAAARARIAADVLTGPVSR